MVNANGQHKDTFKMILKIYKIKFFEISDSLFFQRPVSRKRHL